MKPSANSHTPPAKSAVDELKQSPLIATSRETDEPELIAVIRSSKREIVVVKLPNPEPIQPIVERVMATLEDEAK